jgi:hypothetical protein
MYADADADADTHKHTHTRTHAHTHMHAHIPVDADARKFCLKVQNHLRLPLCSGAAPDLREVLGEDVQILFSVPLHHRRVFEVVGVVRERDATLHERK